MRLLGTGVRNDAFHRGELLLMAAAPSKFVLLLAARGGLSRIEMETLLRDEAKRLSAGLPEGACVTALLRLDDDPFANAPTRVRTFDGTLEFRWERGDPRDSFGSTIEELADRISDRIHMDLSAALWGRDNVVVPCGKTPFRFQYVMRRRRDKTHAQYLDHYTKIHAEFGRVTPGIEGYVQFHVDPEASRAAAAAAEFGIWSADSVSELHLDSVPRFLDEIANWSRDGEAQADEENFVDRMNSVMFTSEELK